MEAELPSMEAGRDGHKLLYSDNIDALSHLFYDYNPSKSDEETERFIAMLRRYGMQDHQVDILVDKFVHNKTWAAIADDRGFTSPGITFYLYKKAVEELKRKGFGPRKSRGN